MSSFRGLDVPESGWLGAIAGLPVDTPAWSAKNWEDLYRLGSKKRRENVIMDGAVGVRGYPGDIGPAGPIDLYWLVVGTHDKDDNEYDDPAVGLEENLALLHSAWFNAPEGARGTTPATIFAPSGKVYVAEIQIDEFVPTGGWEDCELRMSVTIPAGPAFLLEEWVVSS